MARELLKGNVAIAEAAIRAGLQAYFGYPITPQTELLEHLAARMPELGRAFVQAESELGAINMVYGAACTGTRVMSSSSGPGISLMLEGISYIAGTELPMVLVDVMRGGPGLGNIAPSQGDYNQMVHGGGHGDYHSIVLAPANVQEAIDMTVEAFELAEKYRSIVCVLVDGSIGQMMEPAELPEIREPHSIEADWPTTGAIGRQRRFLTSINLDPPAQEQTNLRIQRRWQEVMANEIRYKEYFMEGARYRDRGLRLRRARGPLGSACRPGRRDPGWAAAPDHPQPLPGLQSRRGWQERRRLVGGRDECRPDARRRFAGDQGLRPD